MITFVYYCLCLLIVCCHTTRIPHEDDDFTNDFPPNTKPKMEVFRQKIGTDLLMHCNNHLQHTNDNITWEFKPCVSSYYNGVQCDKKNLYILDETDNEWKKLDFSRNRKKLEIRNITEANVGMFRCLYNDSIIKVYVVDVIVGLRRNEVPPKVYPLILSNSTLVPKSSVVIQCKMASVEPPEVRWLKECHGRKCNISDIQRSCFCLIPSTNFVNSNGSDIYYSKLSINNLRTLDSGVYVCLALSAQGFAQSDITLKVQDDGALVEANEQRRFSFSLLFLIPLCFILVPVTIWLCFYRRKKKHYSLSEHQKQLIKVDIVCRT